MALEIPNVFHAACAVNGLGAASFVINVGCATVTRAGVGDYTLTIANPIGTTEALALAVIGSGLTGVINLLTLSTTQVRVRTFDLAGAALDTVWGLVVFKVA